MNQENEIKVGDTVTWKVPMYDDFIYYTAEVLKVFKNGKAKIQYKNMFSGKPQWTHAELSSLKKRT